MLPPILLVLLSFAAAPQDPPAPRRAVMPKAIAVALPIAASQTRVVVKLVEEHDESARSDLVTAGQLTAPDVLAITADRPVSPFFAGLENELAAIRRRQLAHSARPEVDLARYFQVETRDAADTAVMVRRLNELACVELAYPRELPTRPPGESARELAPGDILPVTPDYTNQQGYRGAAPTGIDADFGRSITGASGQGVRAVEIEWGWDFDHEDISQLRPSALVGPPVWNGLYNDHGLAVVGELAADPDQYGVTGLVPDLQMRVATNYPASGYSVANAIAAGLGVLQAGDLLVLEAQTSTPLGLGPTEWIQLDFDAILVATSLGVITIEAAGNGAVDLDSPILGGLFDRAVRDSGAILVGATNGSASFRAPFSSYGAIVDANGWGYNVVTAGYGNLATIGNDSRQSYTDTFSGTSSATPMVTAAVAALRGAAHAQLHPAAAAAVDGFAIRQLLRNHGTAIAGNQLIGRRVDIEALLVAAGIWRGLSVVGAPITGQTCTLQLAPPSPMGPGDLYGMLGALDASNQALPAPLPASAGRLLLDPATTVTLAIGVHGTTPASLPITVPNDPLFRGLSLFAQGASFGIGTGSVTVSNGVELFLRL